MKCKAKYIGAQERFGVTPGRVHEVDIFTINSEHGTPYMWVSVTGYPAFMMPYVDMIALLTEWQFSDAFYGNEIRMTQEELAERWIEIYEPDSERNDHAAERVS